MTEELETEAKDIVVRKETDLENISLSATAAGLPLMQAGLLDWCKRKLVASQEEYADLQESQTIAIENGFRRHAFDRAVLSAGKRCMYYQKIVAALEAGYVLFPPTEAQIFAVRTTRRHPERQGEETSNSWDPVRDRQVQPSLHLSVGMGRYVGAEPTVYFNRSKALIEESSGATKEKDIRTYFSQDFQDIEFPFEVAKPEILRATSDAMALKIFDEIGIIPQRIRNQDPVVMGRIVRPFGIKYGGIRSAARLNFLISWLINTRDL